MNQGMQDLVDLSREYGSDPRWVVAGGGNTSYKDDDVLYVKASGFALATIGEEGFARMDRRKLAAIWVKEYPSGEDAASVAERERMVLADMMDSRMPGEDRRPSVETQLHDLLPWPLVVHLHPTMVNGLTCGKNGKELAEKLFGDEQMWVPVVDPGYVLARAIRDALEERTQRGLGTPSYIFLANHGVFAGGSDAAEVRKVYSRLADTLSAGVKREPGVMPAAAAIPGDSAAVKEAARVFFGEDAAVSFVTGGELERYFDGRSEEEALTGCLTPDHIVYAGPGALALADAAGDGIAAAWKSAGAAYLENWGKPANIILLPKEKGALVAAVSEKAHAGAALLLENALEVAAYTESFGGPLMLEERFIRFIVNWEVENYRSKMSTK